MPDFKIDDEQFKDLIAQQILASITTETRDRLIAESLQFLMTPVKNQYGRKDDPSPLAQAFRQEILKVATNVVQQTISIPHIHDAIKKAVEDSVTTWIKERDYEIAPIIGEAIRNSVEVSLRER